MITGTALLQRKADTRRIATRRRLRKPPHTLGTLALGTGVIEYIERIQTMEDREQILDALVQSLKPMGIQYFVIAGADRTSGTLKRIVLGDRGHKEMVKRYFLHDYAAFDPVLTEALKQMAPVIWSEVYEAPGREARQRQIFAESIASGMTEGMCIPLVGPDRQPVLANCGGQKVDTSPHARACIQAMMVFTYNRLMHLAARKSERNRKLTTREADCLNWVAQGKTDWEIGEILKISENTVHWYIERAKRKLGVGTRIQAVVTAIRIGSVRL